MEEGPGNNFVTTDHGHHDLVRATAYNLHGNRKATGGADHRVKVYKKLPDGSWKLLDTWRAHDAEIFDLTSTQIKWSSPYLGQVLATVGNDGKFKVWEEDVCEPMNSGHRFKCIFTLHSPSRVPYVSFDFKTVNIADTYLALITRDGHLSVYEASDPESLTSWALVDEFRVCTQPLRGEEDGFKVQFDPNESPCWTAVAAGLSPKALSLVTAGMDTVRVWRTDKLRSFYQAAELAGHRGVLRDVAWGPASTPGYDLIATACKDGCIRIFEVHTRLLSSSVGPVTSEPAPEANGARASSPEAAAVTPSGIGAGLAGASRATGASGASRDHDEDSSRVQHTVDEVACLTEHHGAVWAVKWEPIALEGRELVSAGDDGKLRFWKKAIDGTWKEYATVEAGFEPE
ncbi:MAG: epoxide hydrolase, soluble (sEH) [Thelocarpon impressellum]|nr:MAG: epoxide hydrolase, soluble (sEH) [Thelocarpon impressellum]